MYAKLPDPLSRVRRLKGVACETNSQNMATSGPIPSESGPSFEEILSRHGFKEEDLHRECPRDIRYEIAVELGADWEMIGCSLKFSSDEVRDISRENSSQEMCRVSLLDAWHKREGRGATFLKLARAFHQQKRRDLVDLLCTKLKSTLTLVPLSGNVTSLKMPRIGNDQQLQVLQNGSISTANTMDVPKRIETLIEQFDCLHERLVNELSEGGISVDKVLRALTRLPFTFRKEYESTIQSMLYELVQEKVIHNLFYHLNPLFTFIDYELLQHLVSKFGSQALKQNMASYIAEVQLFKKVITIGELIDCWPGLEVPLIDYTILRAKFADDPKSYTLEKLDSFRNRFYNKLRRSEFIAVSILMLVQPANSFIAMWFIPTVAVQELLVAFCHMDIAFFQAEQILELSLGKRTLYQRNIAGENVTESAMEPVSAFTHVESPPQQADASVDALYSLVVSVKSSDDIHEVYIDAHFHYTALKILKLRCKHKVHGEYTYHYIKNFRFASSGRSLRVIVPEKNPRITAVEPEDGMVRASDIWRESEHEDLQHRLLDYHLKITMRGKRFDPPTIKFEGSTDDSIMDINLTIGSYGHIMVTEDQTRRLQDPLSESDTDESTANKDIQFGYHNAAGKNIRISNNGLGAERMNPEYDFDNGVAYGAQPFKGLAEFEVKMMTYGAKWLTSLRFGVMRTKRGKVIESGSGIPKNSRIAKHHCVWADRTLYNNLVTTGERPGCGYVDLDDLREGDCVGLRLSRDGVLEFTVNGESQGIAAENIYTRNTDIYAVVDHYGPCVATVITKAVTEYGAINLEELCLERLSSWLKSGDEVDRLPLPTRLKDKLKWYFDE